MNESRETNLRVEEVTTAWRPRTPWGTILEHPAWADLDPVARQAAFEQTFIARRLERGLDPEGYSSTVRAVLDRIPRVE